MPACAVVGCRNKPGRRKNCVPEGLTLKFYKIPAVRNNEGEEAWKLSEERRRLWKAAVNRPDIVTEEAWDRTLVCSRHFVNGDKAYLHFRDSPSWLPTLHLGSDSTTKSRHRFKALTERQEDHRRTVTAGAARKRKTRTSVQSTKKTKTKAVCSEPEIVWESLGEEESPESTSASEEADNDLGIKMANSNENFYQDMKVLGGPDDVQVKFEMEDPEYDQSLGQENVIGSLRNSVHHQSTSSSLPSAKLPGSSFSSKQLPDVEERSPSSNTVQNVQIIRKDVVKRGKYLQAKKEATGLRPCLTHDCVPSKVKQNKEVFPDPGQSVTFSMDQKTRGHIMVAGCQNGSLLKKRSAVPMGQLMRPKSPTQKCAIPERDKSHFDQALMVTQVGCEEGERIFSAQKHEMVCAISSQTKFLNSEGQLVSSVDINCYWCNFCNFTTTSKSLLMQHIMEHRFHCKHCHYQSFSRADVIHHAAHSHPAFSETAAITHYCTLLSDYLRVHHPKEAQLDQNRKRKEPPEDDGSGLQQPNKVSRADPGSEKHKMQKSYSTDYEPVDISMEKLESMEEEVIPHEVGSETSSSSSSMTVVTCIPESASASQTVVPSGLSQSTPSASSSPALESTQPVITQIFSAATIPSVLVPETSAFSSYPGSSSSAAASASPLPPPLYPNKMGAGTMQQMRSKLYWSCGYCKFSSMTQSGIKEHSVQRHTGKRCKYIACIKTDDKSRTTLIKSSSNHNSVDNLDHIEQKEVSGEDAFSDIAQSGTVVKCQTEELPVCVKQELIEGKTASTTLST